MKKLVSVKNDVMNSSLSSLFHIADEDLLVETFYSKDLMLLLLNELHTYVYHA